MAAGRTVRGFTLTELAVVLAIVGLLLGAMMITFSTQVDRQNYSETQRRLDEARELLLAFAIVNGRLPCPATCTDPPACTTGSGGDEDPAGGGTCTTYTQGFLPARAIGFLPTNTSGFAIDSWGNPIRYAVASTVQTSASCPAVTATNPPSALTTYWSPPFTSATATGLTNSPTFVKANGVACTPGNTDLVVCRAAPGGTSCAAGQSVTNQNTVVAVVLSTGKNGAQSAAGANETENQDADAVFVYRPPDPSTATGGEYDDVTAWIPIGLLYGRMTAAAVLP
jgi:prepilin-type N-terminal cleavage/methylation domain-containing protein